MTITKTASQRGKSNHRKGVTAEQNVARYLRIEGFPDARRAIHNGWRTAEHIASDPLDIAGIPGLVISVKNDARNETEKWLNEAERVKNCEGAELALLIVRRYGKAEPARWWTWLPLAALTRLTTGARPCAGPVVPVSLELGDLVPLLHAAGYGSSPENAEPTSGTMDPDRGQVAT